MNEKELFKKAKSRVNQKKGFIIHFLLFCGTIPVLFFINFIVTPGFWWFLIAFAGWGLAILIHFVTVYGFLGERGQRWEALQIEKEMDRLLLEEGLEDKSEDFLDLSDYKRLIKGREALKKNWKDEDFV